MITLVVHGPEDVGIYLKRLRKQYKISQETLAKGVGISYYSIIRYEKKNYLQASEEVVFNILGFFSREYVKEAIYLSIMPTHETTPKSGDTSANNAGA